MNLLARRQLASAFRGLPSAAGAASRYCIDGVVVVCGVAPPSQLQQWRGIRVKVFNGQLDGALSFMKRQMESSGVERLIKNRTHYHIKNSEKRVLARKRLERKIQYEKFTKNLREILNKKVRDQR